MDKTAAFLTPAAMEGQGAYNRSSQVQATGLSPALQMFERAASLVPVPAEPLPIVIADYGSSQGRNSLNSGRGGDQYPKITDSAVSTDNSGSHRSSRKRLYSTFPNNNRKP